jgi:glycosyltransferase involved in cell wall biosynthesis
LVPFDNWIFFQLGAREHYVLPYALRKYGALTALFTDVWANPRSSYSWPILARLSSRLISRFEPNLKEARVEHFTKSFIWFEAKHILLGRRSNSWKHIIARNRWFQQRAVQRLNACGLLADSPRAVFHAFSYAARDIFAAAKRAGHFTVLQQVDPGLAEEEIVAETCLRNSKLMVDWSPAPREYWQEWFEECSLADAIVVNSAWSRRGLIAKNVPSEKIVTIPLMYEAADHVLRGHKSFPSRFSQSSPLQVLFLGNLCVRKGIAEMLEAVELLRGAPVRFCFVGPSEVRLPERFCGNPRLDWRGAVPRTAVEAFYRNSHVFILPTHSDGFGLTQLEAQAWGLPVIASSNCGEVVKHGENGLLLPEVSGTAIAETLDAILTNPTCLPVMSARGKETVVKYGLERIFPKFLTDVTRVLERAI